MSAVKKSEMKNNTIDTANVQPMSAFENMISTLPQALEDEIAETDQYLRALRPLKFKRAVDKKAKKITYVASDYGISYMFKISDNQLAHNFQWYIVCCGKPETWHRRADYMEETLAYIAKTDLPLAERIFNALKTCPGLDNCYGPRCLARTVYSFDGQKKLTCHGKVELGLFRQDFCDAREFIRYFNELVNEKNANNEPLPEKIIVCKTKRSL